ncbi:hypothetical protein O6P43_000958 [Quillaja saponaria]|uniref:Uncharacterized protein n=1 Tax=Quillaja saponaria TaxID=32244 RepID=A0AAD7QI07_QUISA|nr:hypothetical protein O6P43_000958 [Quillaja saponaria]
MATRMLLKTIPKAHLQSLRNRIFTWPKFNAPIDQTKSINDALQLFCLNTTPQKDESFSALRDFLGVNQKPLANLVSEEVPPVTNVRQLLENHGFNVNYVVCDQLAGSIESQRIEFRGSSRNQIESEDDENDGDDWDDEDEGDEGDEEDDGDCVSVDENGNVDDDEDDDYNEQGDSFS